MSPKNETSLETSLEISASGDVSIPYVKFNSLDDSSVAKWLWANHFKDRLSYNNSFGWMLYDGRRWRSAEKHEVIELVRSVHDDVVSGNFQHSKDAEELRKLITLLGHSKIVKVVELLKGLLHVSADSFDVHPELLNVGNGILNLRTLELAPHAARFYLTKLTPTFYIPTARHEDIDAAFEAIPIGYRSWLQKRLGQGLTGYMVPDDVLPILYGFGENGKSVFLVAVTNAVGEYATTVSERVLLANPNDHPTEMMTLRGVRLGFIEELPDGKHLPVKRLKDLLGTPRLQARAVHKDNVEWETTHSLFVTTNYLPLVDEIDHGTWRRLKIVPFPYKFVSTTPQAENERRGDPGLRQRLINGGQGRQEAMLAWLAVGASQVLADPSCLRDVPEEILQATNAWRLDVDKLAKFMADNVEFDANSWIPALELHRQFNDWLEDRGFVKWNDQTFAQRFGNHQDILLNGVVKIRVTATREGKSVRTMGGGLLGQIQTNAWIGLRFKDRA